MLDIFTLPCSQQHSHSGLDQTSFRYAVSQKAEKFLNQPHFQRYSEGYFETCIFCQPFSQWTLARPYRKWYSQHFKLALVISSSVGLADNETSIFSLYSHTAIFQPILTVSTSRYFKMKHVTFAPQLDTLMEDEHSVLGVEEEQGVRYPTSHRERKRSRETPSPATGQPKVRSSTPRRIMRSLMRITASTKPTPSTSLPEDESTSPVKSVSPFGLSLGSEEFLAIQEINMCVQGLWMCVANVGGSVLTFDFKMGEVTTTPKVRSGKVLCMQ